MKKLKKNTTKLAVSLLFGFLVASSLTSYQAPCDPSIVPEGESTSNCVSYPDAISNPKKLFTDSELMDRFLGTMLSAGMVSLSIIIIVEAVQSRVAKTNK